MQRPGFDPWVWKIPWRREWLPIPVFLPRDFYRQKNLVGYSPWGCRVRCDWVTNTFTFIVDLQCCVSFKCTPRLFIYAYAAAAAKSLQSCLTPCDPTDGSPPGSSVLGILQARLLEWVPISFSNAWKWKVKVKSFSRVWLFATAWTAAYQAPLSMGISRQEYWSRLPFPSPFMHINISNFFK